MIAFYITAVWMDYVGGRYRIREKVYPEVWAENAVAARELVLAKHKNCICPSVSNLWPLYPQPQFASKLSIKAEKQVDATSQEYR